MKLILENDEFATSSDSLSQETGRSEGQGSWDNEEMEDDTEALDTESGDDSSDVLTDAEPDYPEEYEDPRDSDETETSDEDEEDDDDEDEESNADAEDNSDEDTEQKNTPISNPSRVLKYSEYFSN